MSPSEFRNAPSLEVDICIVGGGLVGLSLAQLIAAELPQIRLALIERQSFRITADGADQASFDSRATALSPGSMEVFDALGIGQDLRQRATPIHSVRVTDRGHIGSTAFSREENAGQDLGYVVENFWMGRGLVDNMQRFPAVRLFLKSEVSALRMEAGGARLRLRSSELRGEATDKPQEEDIRADLLIVADGAESSLRRMLGIDVEQKDYRQHAIIANVEHSLPHHCGACERFSEEGPMALLPMARGPAGQRSALVFTRAEEQVSHWMNMEEKDFLRYLQQAFGHRRGDFLRLGKRHSYPLSLSFAREQVRTSVVLVGNAAHLLHPVAGQGFNLALRDVTQLLAQLKPVHQRIQEGETHRRYGELRTLRAYLDKQIEDQRRTSFVSDGFERLFGSKHPLLQLGRNLGLVALELFPPVRRDVFFRMMGQRTARARLSTFTAH